MDQVRQRPCHSLLQLSLDTASPASENSRVHILLNSQHEPYSILLGPADWSRLNRQVAGPRCRRFAYCDRWAEAPEVPQGDHIEHASPESAQPGNDQPILRKCTHSATVVLNHRYVPSFTWNSHIMWTSGCVFIWMDKRSIQIISKIIVPHFLYNLTFVTYIYSTWQ